MPPHVPSDTVALAPAPPPGDANVAIARALEQFPGAAEKAATAAAQVTNGKQPPVPHPPRLCYHVAA